MPEGSLHPSLASPRVRSQSYAPVTSEILVPKFPITPSVTIPKPPTPIALSMHVSKIPNPLGTAYWTTGLFPSGTHRPARLLLLHVRSQPLPPGSLLLLTRPCCRMPRRLWVQNPHPFSLSGRRPMVSRIPLPSPPLARSLAHYHSAIFVNLILEGKCLRGRKKRKTCPPVTRIKETAGLLSPLAFQPLNLVFRVLFEHHYQAWLISCVGRAWGKYSSVPIIAINYDCK